uniref:START domain-containing protein n=1 Tax=Rheinheimera sp. BAL341 TaxID=1708203 RepID=A0A486XND3_9GAMM
MRFLLTSLMLFSITVAAAEQPWRLYKTVAETRVEYLHNADKLLQVKAQTEVSATPAAFLHLLEDTANITKWAANTEKAELIRQPDANIHIVHTYFTAIWPVSKRDMVTQSVWQQDIASGAVTMRVSDVGQDYPPVKGYVRMQSVQGLWTLTPMPDGVLRIEYQGQADPGGKLPHFIADKVALKAIFNTFSRLAQVLTQYQQPYPGISIP